jgi:hypothetical protein
MATVGKLLSQQILRPMHPIANNLREIGRLRPMFAPYSKAPSRRNDFWRALSAIGQDAT